MPFRGFWTQAAVWEGAGSSSPCPQAAGEEEFEDGSQKSVFVFVFEATLFFSFQAKWMLNQFNSSFCRNPQVLTIIDRLTHVIGSSIGIP